MEESTSTTPIGYLTNDNGSPSSIRLMSIMTLCFGFLVAGFQVYTDRAVTIELFYACMAAAFAPKVVQKLVELKFSPKNGQELKAG